MIVVKPTTITATNITSTDVVEVAPTLYAAGTTYASGTKVGVAGTAGHIDVYQSLQAGNIGHTPSSSPTWWTYVCYVYEEYNAGTTYALDYRVQSSSSHEIYQSMLAGNVGNALTNTTKWSEVSPTNKLKAFDTSNSTQTEYSGNFSYVVAPGAITNVCAVLNATGTTSIRCRMIDPVYGTVYDQTADMSPLPSSSTWWSWFFGAKQAPTQTIFSGMPNFPNASITLDFVGGTIAIGVILLGQPYEIGDSVNYGAKVGIKDYSKKETNTYGDTVLVQRAFAKRANFTITISKDAVDTTQDYLASLRAVPALWVGSDCYQSTIIFGFYRDFDILIERYAVSDCSVEIEGMT